MSTVHDTTKYNGVLFDLKKCIGCGSCTVACKLWNDLDFDGNAHGDDVILDGKNWTVVQHLEVTTTQGEDVLRFVKRQCHHCQTPACASVCFASAIAINEDGAVVYNSQQCAGCRYCMMACPFDVPKYEWENMFPNISKCEMCADKIAAGEATACSASCPTGALTYGNRDELLAEAKARIAADSSYVQSVYGEKEAGGTNWLYISDVEFADLGLPTNVPTETIADNLSKFTQFTPAIFIGGGAIMTGLHLYT